MKNRTTHDNGEKLLDHITVKEYLTCIKIWNKFNMQNMVDYHIYYIHHYLKQDVLLLANVFEKFINTCSKFYKLIPCHYFSSARLSWDAMLKMPRIKLEQTDIAKYLFIEKGLRGGISYICKKHEKL